MRAILLAVVLAFATPALADTVIAPSAGAGAMGSTGNRFPFFTSGMRVQQVYGSSDFTSPMLITAITFRPGSSQGAFGPILLPGITIKMSTTAAAPDGLSTTFATNIGADETTVFSGALTLSSASTGGALKDFDVVITLTTPFLYDPANGNLLIDVVKALGSPARGIFLDRFNVIDSVSRVFSAEGSPGASAGSAGSRGLTTQFTFDAVPEPTSLALVVVGAMLVVRRRRKRA